MTDALTIEKLLAIEEIKQLQAKRIRASDTKDWALYRDIHAPDFVHDAGGLKVAGIDAAIDRVSTFFTGTISIHRVSVPEIEFTSSTTASGLWPMEDWVWRDKDANSQSAWHHGFGYYHETYVRLDGVWKFQSRRLTRLRMESGTISGSQGSL